MIFAFAYLCRPKREGREAVLWRLLNCNNRKAPTRSFSHFMRTSCPGPDREARRTQRGYKMVPTEYRHMCATLAQATQVWFEKNFFQL